MGRPGQERAALRLRREIPAWDGQAEVPRAMAQVTAVPEACRPAEAQVLRQTLVASVLTGTETTTVA